MNRGNQSNDGPIVDDVRRAREQIFAEYHYNLRAMGEDLMRCENQKAVPGGKVVTLPPRRPPGFKARNEKPA
jgi:hypothetical protein